MYEINSLAVNAESNYYFTNFDPCLVTWTNSLEVIDRGFDTDVGVSQLSAFRSFK